MKPTYEKLQAQFEEAIELCNRAADYAEVWKAKFYKSEAAREAMREALELALSFAPKGPVPEGLAPQFYHTLSYQSEIELQQRIDKARAMLREVTNAI